jgi:phage terminase large subunit-like protein
MSRLSSLAGRLADVLQDGGWRAKARPEQLPPPGDAWNGWLLMAGRGFGKTRTGAEWVRELVETGAARHIALIGATAGDTRDVMCEGPAGILAVSSPWCRPEYEPSKRRLTWPNGAIASTFSSEEADRLRGPQHDALWGDELASWNDAQATWDQAMFGLRVGRHPRWLATTTPRPIKLLKELLAREGKDVVVTRGTTFENAANLAGPFLETIRKRYEGTRLGRQELDGELLSDTPGALWQLAWLDAARVEKAPDLTRVVVAIDPAVTSGEDADETGIVVAGISGDHAYVLEDASGRYAPHQWAEKAIALYRKWHADRVLAEINNGGQMVESTIRMVDPNVSYRAVHASRGKVIRAEPVSALYEQSRVHHVGTFASLEDQLCSFTSDFDRSRAGYSPDRLDALVWALSELMVQALEPPPPTFGTYGRDVAANRFGYIPGSGDDRGAGAIFASQPAEFWASQGFFHPNDREMWIRKGVYRPRPTEEKST